MYFGVVDAEKIIDMLEREERALIERLKKTQDVQQQVFLS